MRPRQSPEGSLLSSGHKVNRNKLCCVSLLWPLRAVQPHRRGQKMADCREVICTHAGIWFIHFSDHIMVPYANRANFKPTWVSYCHKINELQQSRNRFYSFRTSNQVSRSPGVRKDTTQVDRYNRPPTWLKKKNANERGKVTHHFVEHLYYATNKCQ